jgi:hypothetical protein
MKGMLEDYEGALLDLDDVDILEPDDAFVLKARGGVKRMLEDYEGALLDLDNANIFEPNDAFVLKA